MKRSDVKDIKDSSRWAAVLMWAVPLLMLVPNVALDFTELQYSPLVKAVNVLLPAGVYLLLMSCSRNVGRTTVFFFPLMVLCAFQIVLLFLYGESIIAVDMFMNVLTTNVHEAGELLMNLGVAIAVVLVLYLPPLVAGCVLWYGRRYAGVRVRRVACVSGAVLAIAGVSALVAAIFLPDGYRPCRTLFPVNVVHNMIESVRRTEMADAYSETSASFRYHASDTRKGSEPEIYVLVIGETSRAGNWQLNGYDRPTNPCLSKRGGLVSYQRALSESNTTHKSVPLLMSSCDASQFGDSIYYTRSVIDAFREAGYRTGWFSGQQRNHSLIDFFGERADIAKFIVDDCMPHYDKDLCTCLDSFISDNRKEKLFVVLHTYGSHFNYKERYPASDDFFGDDDSAKASKENRTGLINAYDNSIRYVDSMLDSVASILETSGRKSAMVYLADHGEDIFDDSRERFLHASPTPTFWQLHVPVLVWMSDAYRSEYPEKHKAAIANSGKNVSSSRSAFHTLMSLAGVDTPYYEPSSALCEYSYREPERIYLDDYNEGISLEDCGLRESDFIQFRRHGISIK